jgi:hypothetical protein
VQHQLFAAGIQQPDGSRIHADDFGNFPGDEAENVIHIQF